MVKITLSAKWNNLIHIVEDTAILGRKMMMIVVRMMMIMSDDHKDYEGMIFMQNFRYFYRYCTVHPLLLLLHPLLLLLQMLH